MNPNMMMAATGSKEIVLAAPESFRLINTYPHSSVLPALHESFIYKVTSCFPAILFSQIGSRIINSTITPRQSSP